MLKKLFLSLMLSLTLTSVCADEGMWLPSLIGSRIKDMRKKGFRLSAEDIYSNVWNDQTAVGDNTIAVHVRHIREKIEINPKEPKYLKVVWGIGYKID